MTTTANDTMTIGTRLVELCRNGANLDAVNELYAKDIVSVEACGGPEMQQTTTGIEAVRGKNQWWIDNHDVHGQTLEGPFPHEDRFVVSLKYDVTPKAGPMAGKRFTMEEMGLYTVNDGKIVKEEFFYNMG